MNRSGSALHTLKKTCKRVEELGRLCQIEYVRVKHLPKELLRLHHATGVGYHLVNGPMPEAVAAPVNDVTVTLHNHRNVGLALQPEAH